MSEPAAPPPAFRPSLAELFRAFAVVSISAFGGALPWARRMIVEQKRWMTTEEFNETFALSQFLPGPNVINFSVVFGARFGGPSGAAVALAGPPKRAPNTTEKLITFGPGRNCESAKVSLNSSVVIQRFCSTIMRRAHGSAPPKAEIDTPAKARNSSASEGCKAGGGAAGSDICREGLHRRGARD